MNHTHRRKKSLDSKAAVDRDTKPNWMKWALNAKAAMKSKSEVNDAENVNGSSPNVAPMFCTDDWSIDYTPKKKNTTEKNMLGKRSVSVRFDLSALSIDYDKCQPQGAKSECTSVQAVGEGPDEDVSIFDAFKEKEDCDLKDKDDRIDVLVQEKDGLLVELDEASTENANVVEHCFDLASENETLKGENEKLKQEKVEMQKQLDEASMENENVVEHCFDLVCENETLKIENETLKMTMAEMKGAFLGATTKSKKQTMFERRKKANLEAVYGESEMKMTAMERQSNLRREKKDLRVARRKKKALLALKQKATPELDDTKASHKPSKNESDAGLNTKLEVPQMEAPQMFWVMDFMEKSPGCCGENVVGDMKDNTLASKKANWLDCIFPWLFTDN